MADNEEELAIIDEAEDDPTDAPIRNAYTGTYLQKNDPTKYEAIVELLGRGVAKKVISRDMRCHYYTVANIEANAFPDVVAAKKLLSAKLLSAATASVDSAERRALQGKATALDAKLLTEAYLNVNGEASQTVDINHIFPQLSEFGRDNLPAEREVAAL